MPDLSDMVGRLRLGPRRKDQRAHHKDERALRREQMRHDAETYLNGDLKARLKLSNITMFEGNYQNALAESPHGKLLVKFYPDYVSFKVSRSVVSSSLLTRHGLKVPEVVYADASAEGLEEHGLSCVVTRWAEGTPMAVGDPVLTDQAFRLLARVHCIVMEDLDEGLLREFDRSLRQAVDRDPEVNDLRYAIGVIRQVSDAVPQEEAIPVEEFLVSQLERATAWNLPRVLVHMDYQPENLIITPDGEIVMIDFEGSTFGGFYLDLTRALFKFGYKTTSTELNTADIEELSDSKRFNFLLHSYFTEAPDEARYFWAEHRNTVVAWGYLKTLRSLAQKALRHRKSGRLKYRRTTKQLRQRWENVLRYVDRAART